MSETKLMALREAVNLAMSEEMRKDENIFLMGEDRFVSMAAVILLYLSIYETSYSAKAVEQ